MCAPKKIESVGMRIELALVYEATAWKRNACAMYLCKTTALMCFWDGSKDINNYAFEFPLIAILLIDFAVKVVSRLSSWLCTWKNMHFAISTSKTHRSDTWPNIDYEHLWTNLSLLSPRMPFRVFWIASKRHQLTSFAEVLNCTPVIGKHLCLKQWLNLSKNTNDESHLTKGSMLHYKIV